MNKEFWKKEVEQIKQKLDREMVLQTETIEYYKYLKTTYKSCDICNTIWFYDLILEVQKDVEIINVEIWEKYDGSEWDLVNEFKYENPKIENINNIFTNFDEYVNVKVCKCSMCFDENGVRIND